LSGSIEHRICYVFYRKGAHFEALTFLFNTTTLICNMRYLRDVVSACTCTVFCPYVRHKPDRIVSSHDFNVRTNYE